jgi:hypothetical protein
VISRFAKVAFGVLAVVGGWIGIAVAFVAGGGPT